jgi:hypothetical protein
MTEVERALEALIRKFKVHENDERTKDVRLSHTERTQLLAAVRVALQAERLG